MDGKATSQSDLAGLWRSGALAGENAEHAFRLRCDHSLNDSGRMDSDSISIEVGLALTTPGQFYTYRLQLDTTGFDD